MKLPICLIGEDSLALASLRQQLEREPAFFTEPRVHGYSDAFDYLRSKSGPVVAVIDLNRDEERAFAIAAEIKFKLTNVHLVMTSPDHNPQTILRAMRSGAEEYLTQPFNWPEVLKSFDHIRKKIDVHSSSHRGVERGKIIAISSNKGGVGSTTLATNLASNLAARNKSVCLVDLVLQFGSVTSFLNIDASYTILDLAKNVKRIDPLLLDGSLVKHSSGVRVLAEPFYAEDARKVTPSDIDEILDVLAQSFDFVIIDTAKEFDEMLALVLDKASLILFVTEMDVPSLKSAHRAFELFERMGIYVNKIRLILNRYVKSKLMSLESVEKALGVKVFWTLPNNYPTAIAAVNQGLSVHECDPRSDIADSYSGLTTAVLECLAYPGLSGRREEDEDKKSGILGRWIPVRGLRK
jgi:pilus assembly protein CpaE